MNIADLLSRRGSRFVLWAPNQKAPALVFGRFLNGTPPTLDNEQVIDLKPDSNLPGLFELDPAVAGIADGEVIHYWFEVDDRFPASPTPRVRITDPLATTTDWRLCTAPSPAGAFARQPLAVVKYSGGHLIPCDPGGEELNLAGDVLPDQFAPNNRIVIYELPTAWSASKGDGTYEQSVGTFRDVRALVDRGVGGANFDDLRANALGEAHLLELGINALELLPPADSSYDRSWWGYGTSHFLAPDQDLGFPDGHDHPTANFDLADLVRACHKAKVRLFVDVVMAFGRDEAYANIAFSDFYILNASTLADDDPEKYQSSREHNAHNVRDGYGSSLFRHSHAITGYDPVTGNIETVHPSRALMFTALDRWMRDFNIDGIRMDSVNNVANWDFVKEYKDRARNLFQERWTDAGLVGVGDDRFLVVGEELNMPMDLIENHHLDGLWNEGFLSRIRGAILGQGHGEESFELTIQEMVDCQKLKFKDGSQAVNYVTSHDVEGDGRMRLFNFLKNRGLSPSQAERRIKLAFACLLTSVGVPMILAGEEFADEHDLVDRDGNVNQTGGKQYDPVDFNRLYDTSHPLQPMRRSVFEFVSRLVKLRAAHPGLATNEANFIHCDFEQGKRVLGWVRGPKEDPVVIVANFSDFGTDVSVPGAEYKVNGWPDTPVGRSWRDASQDRPIDAAWVGREPIFPWEAKVYVLA